MTLLGRPRHETPTAGTMPLPEVKEGHAFSRANVDFTPAAFEE